MASNHSPAARFARPFRRLLQGISKALRQTRPVRSRRQGGWSLPEALEARILPATLVGANSVSYQDADGDTVTVTFSKSFLTPANVNSVFTFEGQTVNGSNATPTFLRSINLTGIAAAALTTITTSANRNNALGGDGYASLGQIIATNLDLGKVTIDGDLGRITAGDANSGTAAIASLAVNSMGRFGTLTGAASLISVINGKLTAMTVKTDVKDVMLQVSSGTKATDGQIGTLTIKGSLIGGMAPASGLIYASGAIGTVVINGDMVGGAGGASGDILCDDKITSVTVGGSVLGGTGTESARIFGSKGVGTVKITGDLVGGGTDSAQIASGQAITSVTIGGEVRGGTGDNSAQLKAGTTITSATISGSVVGGGATYSGSIISDQTLGTIKIGGSLIGGAASQSGQILSEQFITSVSVGGDVRGGSGFAAGSIFTFGGYGTITIGGSLVGGSTGFTGVVSGVTNAASLTIGGSVIGGESEFSSAYLGSILIAGTVTTLTIKGSIVGGLASGSANLMHSGSVMVGRIGTMTLGGSLIAGVDWTTGTFHSNGAIRSSNEIGSLTIKGSVVGNTTNQAVIAARGATTPTATSDVAISKLTVTGRMEFCDVIAGVSVTGGFDPINANADAQIGTVIINGDFVASNIVAGSVPGLDGKYGTADDVKMSGGVIKDVATVFSKITSLTIGGAIFGTTATNTDHFGIVAGNVGAFKISGTTIPLLNGNGNDVINLSLLLPGVTTDVVLREIL